MLRRNKFRPTIIGGTARRSAKKDNSQNKLPDEPSQDPPAAADTSSAEKIEPVPPKDGAYQESSAPKPVATPTRRRRTTAVPNLGKPRVRQRAEKPLTADKEEKNCHESNSLQDPPPVTRLAKTIVRPSEKTSTTKAVRSASIEKLVVPSSTSSMQVGSMRPPPTPTRGERHSEKRIVTPIIHDRRIRDMRDIEKEQETPAKRRKRYVKSQCPDRNKMTMSDLIYYNPKNNPMKSSLADLEAKKSSYTGTADSGDEIVLGSVNQIPNEDENEVMDEDHVGKDNTPENEENVEKEAVEEEGDNAMPVPQVRISEDGTIVVNEASLLVEASPPKTHDHCDSEVVYEKASYTTYASFKKKTHTSAWTDRETNKFYKALSTVGTDFTLINAILPNRTRHEIKNKFKKEERINRGLVDHAIKLRKHFDMSVFEQTESDIEAEKEEQRKRDKKQRKSKSYKPRQKRGRKKKTSNKQKHKEDDDESDADVAMESNEEEEAEAKDGDDNEDEDVEINTILGKPTRSGRQPKIVKSFTVNTECLGRKRRGRAKDIPQGSILAVPTLQTQKTANEFDKYASPSVASDTSDSHKEKQDTPTVHKETINDAQTPGSDTQGSLVAAGENIVIIHNPGSGSSRNIVIVHTPNARNAASALVTGSPDIAAAGIETTPLSGMKITQLMVNDVQQIQASNHGSQIDEVINNNADVSKITVDNETTVVDSLDNCAVIESLVNSGVIESLSNKRTSESVVTDDGVIDTLDSGEIITPSECSEIIEVEDNLIEVEDVETSDIIESSDEFMGAEAVVEMNASQHVSRGIMMTATSLPFIPPTVPVTTSSSITNVINMNIKDHTD